MIEELLFWRMKFWEKVSRFADDAFEKALDDYYGTQPDIDN